MNDENFDEQFKKLNSKGYLYIKNDFLDQFRDHKNYFLIKQIYNHFEKLLKIQFKQLNKKLQNTLAPDYKLEIDLYYFKLNFLMLDAIEYIDLHYPNKQKKSKYKSILNLLEKFNLIDLLFHLDKKILELYKNFIVDISNEKPSDNTINFLKNFDSEQYLNVYYKIFYENLKNNFFKQFTTDLKKYLNWTFLSKESNEKFNTYFLSELHQLNFDEMYKTYFEFYFHIIRQTVKKEANKHRTFMSKIKNIEFDKAIFENFYDQVELNLMILHFIELYHDLQNKGLANFFEVCNRTYLKQNKINSRYTRKQSVLDNLYIIKSNNNIKTYSLIELEKKYRSDKKKILAYRKRFLVNQIGKQKTTPASKIKR